jgi:hypothetical protein
VPPTPFRWDSVFTRSVRINDDLWDTWGDVLERTDGGSRTSRIIALIAADITLFGTDEEKTRLARGLAETARRRKRHDRPQRRGRPEKE